MVNTFSTNFGASSSSCLDDRLPFKTALPWVPVMVRSSPPACSFGDASERPSVEPGDTAGSDDEEGLARVGSTVCLETLRSTLSSVSPSVESGLQLFTCVECLSTTGSATTLVDPSDTEGGGVVGARGRVGLGVVCLKEERSKRKSTVPSLSTGLEVSTPAGCLSTTGTTLVVSRATVVLVVSSVSN